MKFFSFTYKLGFGLLLGIITLTLIQSLLISTDRKITLYTSCSESTPIEIFYCELKDHYTADQVVRDSLSGGSRWTKKSFSLQDNFQFFRLDIGKPGQLVKIKKIQISQGFFLKTFNSKEIIEVFEPNTDISECKIENDYVSIQASGFDPNLVLTESLDIPEIRSINKSLFRFVRLLFIALLTVGILYHFRALKKHKPYLVIGISALFFIPFIILEIFKMPGNNTHFENRQVTERPKITNQSTLTYLRDYNTYYLDNFGARDYMIRSYSMIKYYGLGASSNYSSVSFGDDDWMFFMIPETVDLYQNKTLFSEEELQEMAKNILKKEEWLKQRGAELYLTFPPNKENIYSEKAPKRFKRYREYRRYHQLIDYLKKNTELKIIEVESQLFDAKKDYELYYPHDSHWNLMGGFIAYQEIINRISKDFPEIGNAYNLDDYLLNTTLDHKGDLMRLLSLDDLDYNTTYHFKPKFNSKIAIYQTDTCKNCPCMFVHSRISTDTTLPKLITISDSYFNNVMPFTAEHFSESYYVQSTTHYFHEPLIEDVNPDIVIIEFLERFIYNLRYYD